MFNHVQVDRQRGDSRHYSICSVMICCWWSNKNTHFYHLESPNHSHFSSQKRLAGWGQNILAVLSALLTLVVVTGRDIHAGGLMQSEYCMRRCYNMFLWTQTNKRSNTSSKSDNNCCRILKTLQHACDCWFRIHIFKFCFSIFYCILTACR